MSEQREKLLESIKGVLKKRTTPNTASGKLWEAMERGRASRASLIASEQINVSEFKHGVRSVKTNAGGDPALTEGFAKNIERNGGHVFFAKDGKAAIQYVVELCNQRKAKLVLKAKSLTTEEIEFNHGLEAANLKVVETDLGELVCQVAKEKPSHLVFPAVHKTAEEIAELFSKEYREEITSEPSDILSHIRKHLRPLFLSADVGVTGANIGVAETGSIIIETNEGNGRLVTSIPKTHVVIIGLEKIVGKWDDASKLVQGHSVSATGQRMTVYVSVISGRSSLGGPIDDGREFHVVILDNGRNKMREDPWFKDALNCIRCGACMNICPTYGIVGGHVFGYIYPGPIGIPWTANVHGLDKSTFAHLCVSCGLCKEICPADIDIPMMIAKVKEEDVKENGQLLVNSFFVASERLAKFACATAPLSNYLIGSRASRFLMEKSVGVDRRRTLPKFARTRLRKRLEQRKKKGATLGKVGVRRGEKVVFFPDLYADYNDPELGVRAIDILENLGFSVVVPKELRWSGMPYVSYGEVERARKVARQNLEILSRFSKEGYDIVSTEPTAIYMLKDIYPKLDEESETSLSVSSRSYSFFRFIEQYLDRIELSPSESKEDVVGFHIPCHERALDSGRPAISFLEKVGYSVKIVETGTCCGMAGTFGMKKGALGYDLSMAVGSKLFERFAQSGCKLIATESSVCSAQLKDGLGYRVLHPLYFAKTKTSLG